MELYPAIDIQAGGVARAAVSRAPAYGDDPEAAARAFAAAGASWLHVVDLDRAFGRGDNRDVVRRVLSGAPLRIQVGGGLRSEEAIADMFAWGAARVVAGTRAALDAALLARLLRAHGAERLAVAIDARDGRVTARGRDEVYDLAPGTLAERVRVAGVRTVVYTAVRRDGMLAGLDLEGARRIAGVGLDVIASGGVASLDDLRAARAAGLAGAIVGRALHEGRFTLAQALACLAA